MQSDHGKFCDICKKFIKGGKVDHHFYRHEKEEEKRLRKFTKQQESENEM